MGAVVSAILALVAGAAIWFASKMYVARRRMRGLPGPPHHPFWGHLLVMRQISNQFPPDVHPHIYVATLRSKYNLGPIFYIDSWPFGPQFVMVTDPEIADQFTVVKSLPKSAAVADYVDALVGHNNLISLDGRAWKNLRAMFNPGFASGHLMTLVPYIVDAAAVFANILGEHADKAGAVVVRMEELATRLTVDVIGKVTLDIDLNSQRQEHRIVTTFRRQVALMPVATPANVLGFLVSTLTSPPRLWWNGRKLDRYVGEALDERYAKRAAEREAPMMADEEKPLGFGGSTKKNKKTQYAVDLALEAYERNFQHGSKENTSRNRGKGDGSMDASFRQSAIVQIKAFIFAGHDTTSSTLSWIIYLLHRHPDVHTKLVAELDSVFGPVSSSSAADQIKADPYLINLLPYATAIIKETLRLFPPVSTIRYGDPSLTITDPSEPRGRAYPTADFHVWSAAHAIHRNEDYFPNPTSFVPERHLHHLANPVFPTAKQHRNALRPFEAGPRNCLGQELATIELRVIIAMTVREYDLDAVYPEGTGTVEGHKCYQILKGAAKPNQGLPGVVKRR